MKPLMVVLAALVFVAGACARESDPQASPDVFGDLDDTHQAACVLEGAAREPVEGVESPDEVALLSDVAVQPEACPQVVFSFENTVPEYRVSYQEPPFVECGSGDPIVVDDWEASAYLVVHLQPASGVDLSGPDFRQAYTGSPDIDAGGDVLRRVHRMCDFEANMEWVVGLAGVRDFKVEIGADSVVLDLEEAPPGDR